MPDTQALEALLSRVEAATAPDTIIDRDLHQIVIGRPIHNWVVSHGPHLGKEVPSDRVPPYTASLDAIVAQIEREMPDCMRRVFDDPDRDEARADLIFGGGNRVTGHGYSWALALCAAFLRAYLAMERQP